jgi:predicted alpha/beta-fold hydrolase
MHGACPTVSLVTPRGYNGAYTGDLRSIINQISSQLQDLSSSSSLFLVGYSLGGKYLGEEGYNETVL